MTDKETIVGLKCCCPTTTRCSKCPYDGIDCCIKSCMGDAVDLINRQQAEIERLEKEVGEEFICFVGDPHKVEHCPYLEQLETAKAEAIKEFAERLKRISRLSSAVVDGREIHKIIDNLVQEMAGDSLCL